VGFRWRDDGRAGGMNADYERNGSMSTPAAIARWTNRTSHEWAGRYHHWDSYPSALGATLFDLVRHRTLGDLATTLRVLIDDHPAGWSTIRVGLCSPGSLSASGKLGKQGDFDQTRGVRRLFQAVF